MDASKTTTLIPTMRLRWAMNGQAEWTLQQLHYTGGGKELWIDVPKDAFASTQPAAHEVTVAYVFPNGMVMAFDAAGEQVPEYQGTKEDVLPKLKRDFPKAALCGV